MVPTPKGAICPILDLKALNVFFKAQKFGIEFTRSVMATLYQEDFLASVDFKDMYLHVSNFPTHPLHAL